MHSNLGITDGVYGILSDGDVKKKEILVLGLLPEKDSQLDKKTLVNILKATINQLESRFDQNHD